MVQSLVTNLFETVAKELGVEHKIYSPPYRPQSNGRIEGFHAFLKTCLAKHVSPSVEWDEVCTLATAAYNFLPNEHSRCRAITQCMVLGLYVSLYSKAIQMAHTRRLVVTS